MRAHRRARYKHDDAVLRVCAPTGRPAPSRTRLHRRAGVLAVRRAAAGRRWDRVARPIRARPRRGPTVHERETGVLGDVRNRGIRRAAGSGADPAARAGAARVPWLRLRRAGGPERPRARDAQARRTRRGARRRGGAGAARRGLRDRAHALGDPRRAHRAQRPPARRLHRDDRPRAQRHYRERRRAPRVPRARGPSAGHRDRYGDPGAPDRGCPRRHPRGTRAGGVAARGRDLRPGGPLGGRTGEDRRGAARLAGAPGGGGRGAVRRLRCERGRRAHPVGRVPGGWRHRRAHRGRVSRPRRAGARGAAAGLVGRHLIEELAGIPVEVEYASEYRYRRAVQPPGTLAVAISQSGETADTLEALRTARAAGSRVLGIVNVVGSTIAREADGGIYLHAGPEIGVASTKAFTSQLVALTLLGLYLGRRRGLDAAAGRALVEQLDALPDLVAQALAADEEVDALAARFAGAPNALYLGRGVNYPVALEGALKLKEISYVHAEGYPAAEMKHGPIALIDENMPVVFVAPRDPVFSKVVSNMQEVKARGGQIIAVTTQGNDDLRGLVNHELRVPVTAPLLTPVLTVIPLQLLAYHIAARRGCDVDRPRNLAKSVTVE